jgi:hypothetical protein
MSCFDEINILNSSSRIFRQRKNVKLKKIALVGRR